jgi:hypothetical protein
MNMEWEEALLRAWGGELSPPASDHRHQASRPRLKAEDVDAVKARLLDTDRHDEVAHAADRAARKRSTA